VCTEKTLEILPFTNNFLIAKELYATLDTTALNGPQQE